MTATAIRRNARTNLWTKIIDRISLPQAFLVSWATMLLKIYQMVEQTEGITPVTMLGFGLFFTVSLLCFYMYALGTPHRQLMRLQTMAQKLGLWPVVWLVTFLVLFLDTLTLPSYAGTGNVGGTNAGFFFTNIKTKVNAIFTGSQAAGINEVVNFGFGVLQILFIIYIAWAIARVISASREDEDWKQVAKTPVVIAAALFGGDWLVGLI